MQICLFGKLNVFIWEMKPNHCLSLRSISMLFLRNFSAIDIWQSLAESVYFLWRKVWTNVTTSPGLCLFISWFCLSIFYQFLTRMGRGRQRQSLRLSDQIYHEIEHLHKRMRSVLWLGLTPLAPPFSFGKAERSYKAYELSERS